MSDLWTKWTTPSQSRTKYTNVDPLQHYKPQQQVVENALGQSLGQGSFPVNNPAVGPNQWQTGAIDQLSGMQQAATPAFTQGLSTTQKTMGGGYLDPMKQAGFANVAADRGSIAQSLFGGAMASPAMQEDPRFASAARTAQQAREQQRIGTRAEADIGEAQWKQYGEERNLQQAAMARALGLAPDLASALFTGGEALRSGEQEANSAAMMASLRAQGYDQDAISQAIKYLDLASGKTLGPVTGPVPAEISDRVASQAYKAYAGCWVAAALYGADTPAHRLARYWIMDAWRGPTATLVRGLYRRVGPVLARAVTRWPACGRLIRPWFDQAVRRGLTALEVEHRG
jgi:hypothetical protein